MIDDERERIRQAAWAQGWTAGYAEGGNDRERELLPFHGVGRVRFRTDVPRFDGEVVYEADVRCALQSSQRDVRWASQDVHSAELAYSQAAQARSRLMARRPEDVEFGRIRQVWALLGWWRARYEASGLVDVALERWNDERDRENAIRELNRDYVRELTRVRTWLDDELDGTPSQSRMRYARDRRALRRDNAFTVAVTRMTTERFFEDPAHRDESWPSDGGPPTPGGVDFGHEWSWELPERDEELSVWSIYWLRSGEIYARHRAPYVGEDFSAADDHGVILLGSVLPWPGWTTTDNFLYELQMSVMRAGHNSLVAAAEAVAEQMTSTTSQRARGDDEP